MILVHLQFTLVLRGKWWSYSLTLRNKVTSESSHFVIWSKHLQHRSLLTRGRSYLSMTGKVWLWVWCFPDHHQPRSDLACTVTVTIASGFMPFSFTKLHPELLKAHFSHCQSPSALSFILFFSVCSSGLGCAAVHRNPQSNSASPLK